MGLCEALDGSFKYASSCFIKMCICRDVLKGANKIFIRMLLCDKSRRGASSAAGGHLQSWPRRRQPGSCRALGGPWGGWPWSPPARETPATSGGSGTALPAETPRSAWPWSGRCRTGLLPLFLASSLACPVVLAAIWLRPPGATARCGAAGAAQCAWAGAGSGGGWRGQAGRALAAQGGWRVLGT